MQRKSIMFSRIVLFLLLLSLPAGLSAQVQEYQEYKDYTVERGDTLWDITKEELQDPFLWPKVWNENPDIDNPDKIYPNQKIKIPLYLLQKEIAPPAPKPMVKPSVQPKPEEKPVIITKPSQKEYLVDKNLLILSGYIADALHSVGTIYDKPGEITNLTKGDYAYIKTNNSVRKGDKFYIIYPVGEVKHPVTGRYIGVRIAILGTAEVVDENDPKVFITSSYVEIPVGSLIDNYYEIEPPLAVDNPRKPEINGYIVTTLRRIYAHGNLDIVFIDKGKNDGLEVGDLLATTLQSEHKIFNGVVQIISTRPSTSAAIIRKAAKEIQIGDPVTAVKQE
ncbi:MAG: LysM peptidoglycan-binding domain-containing protein [Thermodesulfovibrionales bacterium]|nr:LysM peptidoglycan-binding domain-containing protein [Thermodesulfovibrionales bacterium]